MLSFEVKAQRIVNELEANTDGSMMASTDSVFNDDVDENGKKKKKNVPTDVRAWTVDEIFGNITPAIVDTITHLYQNNNLPEGPTGHYQTLGNDGSPRQSRIYMERPDVLNFIFLTPLQQYFVPTDRFKFYNTKSPYMNISYNFCGSKNTGYDHVKATYTNNAGKRINFGGCFDYVYGQGFYANQSTSFMNASAWASYLGDKYNFHLYYQHNYVKMAENGGISDIRYITQPEIFERATRTEDIPTYLSRSWNRQEHDVVFFNHHYNIGFTRSDIVDSTKTVETFVPVTKFFHTFKLLKAMRNHRSFEKAENFYDKFYYPGDSCQDVTKSLQVRNIVGVSLCEGFNKWAAFGINLYAGHEYRRYLIPDSMQNAAGQWTSVTGELETRKDYENDIFIGGQILRTQGNAIHFDANGQIVVVGANVGNFDINGKAELNLPFLKDSLHLVVKAFVKTEKPGYYFRHMHGRNLWWDNDLSNEWKARVAGIVTIDRTKTQLSFAFETIKNYTYFINNGGRRTIGNNTYITNNAEVRQSSTPITVTSATLTQDFRLGILHWDNEVTYQLTSNKDVLPLPVINAYTNLYLKFRIAKVLGVELGGDMRYFTKYLAPDYNPSLGMFTTQNELKREYIGNYPIIGAYANLDLKKLRFYVQYYHANQSTGRYLWAPGYPISPAGIHFGLNWNFYD